MKMLLITLLFLVLTFAGIILFRKYEMEITGLSITSIAGLLLIANLIAWPTSYYSDKANILIYESMKQTIEYSRSNEVSDLERASLTTKIIEINKYLANAKYWNDTIFGDLVPDDFAALEYLK